MEALSRNIRAIAICGNCGSQEFKIAIYTCGHDRPICIHCGQVWKTPVGGSGQYLEDDEAMGEDGDEPRNLVSP